MTNPDSIVRVHSRNGGRASVLETNQWAQVYNQGILVGNGVSASTGLTVEVGGSTGAPDVLIAETPAGYKVSLDVIGTTTLTLTAPASNSKIVAIVAYTDDLSIQSTEDTVTGSPSTCGLLAVDGTIAANPSAPTDAQIRTAITADGATGSQAAYAVIATVTLSSDTTDITSSLIARRNSFLQATGLRGTTERKNCPNGSTKFVVTIPHQPNTNYGVQATLSSAGAYWATNLSYRIFAKLEDSITLDVWNDGAGTVSDVTLDWLIIP